MTLPDINVLVYAHRADSQEHEKYANWLRECVRSPSPFALSDFVITGFLRIVTHRKIFTEPTPRPLAVQFIDELLKQNNSVLVLPTSRQWELTVSLCEQADVTGAMVSDAYLAALAIDHGCELITCDGDFARFPELRWRHPLSA